MHAGQSIRAVVDVLTPAGDPRMAQTGIETAYEKRCFGGVQGVYAHASRETGCAMRFGVFLPPQAARAARAGAVLAVGPDLHRGELHREGGRAARRPRNSGIALVVPDTSPRGLRHRRGRRQLGLRAGRGLLRRRDRGPVGAQLPDVLVRRRRAARARRRALPGRSRRARASSDTRWAGTARWSSRCATRSAFRSVSAFAPIAAPMRCPWGEKAFDGLPRSRPRALARVRRVRARRDAGLARAADPRRPGHRRPVPRHAAETRAACRKRAGAPACRSNCACGRATTTATSSSRRFIDDHLRYHARHLGADAAA